MSGVKTVHPDYEKMLPEWSLVSACSSGSREVKKLGVDVLPAPGARNTQNGMTYDVDRYDAYKKRAIYTNITGRTKTGLTGAAFRLPPKIDLPTGLEYLNDNADGAGQSLEQMTKDSFCGDLETGRELLLSDYPEVEQGLTAEQEVLIGAKAYIKRYGAVDLINWKTESIGGAETLTLAVLQECYDKSQVEFSHDQQKQYRVLRLRDDGYSQQIYRDDNPIEDERYPTKADGSRFDRIPLFCIGAQNNGFSVDDVPLSDIAQVNIGHYRNSADLEESSYIVGQPMIHVDIGDTAADEWKTLNSAENGVAFGSTTSVQTIKGRIDMVQVSENQLTDKLQERKEAQMLALGAKLVEQRNPNETAAAAKIDATGENSVLSDLVGNIEEGYRRAIEWCGMFMGVDVDGSEALEMNRQFFEDSVDPQMVMASIQGYDRAIIAKSDLQNVYRKAGVIDAERTNDDIDNETGQANILE